MSLLLVLEFQGEVDFHIRVERLPDGAALCCFPKYNLLFFSVLDRREGEDDVYLSYSARVC